MQRYKQSIRVLEILRRPETGRRAAPYNPYTILTVESLDPSKIHVLYFTWARALFGRYDVVHIHWPEQLLRGHSRLHTLSRVPAVVVLLFRWWALRTPIVRTVHNENPHESGSQVLRSYLAVIDRLTTEWVILTEATQRTTMASATLIPHGHYRSWYPVSDRKADPGALLVFGLIRPYKGIDALIGAFSLVPDRDARLRIVGRPGTPQLADELTTLAAHDPRISLVLAFVPDQDLANEIAAAEFVVLPYRDMHNSGAALLALSLNRPVIVPTTEATELMSAEFGEEWVIRYRGTLTSDSLREAIERGRMSGRADAPDMSKREWDALGTQLTDVLYRAAARF